MPDRPTSTFTSTKFSTSKDKEAFLKKLCKFVEKGFPSKSFPQSFYTRLSNMFGHIAHYNRDGFYKTWFADPSRQSSWSDVERAFQTWLQNEGAPFVAACHEKAAKINLTSEISTLKRLIELHPTEARQILANL